MTTINHLIHIHVKWENLPLTDTTVLLKQCKLFKVSLWHRIEHSTTVPKASTSSPILAHTHPAPYLQQRLQLDPYISNTLANGLPE